MPKKIYLLSIDPQFDFCDPSGALYVPGAGKDMERLAAMINRCRNEIDDIIVTLDSHRTVHIAHPIWWVDQDGNHPAPFTLINEEDVTGPNPKYRAYNPDFQKRSIEYVQTLKENGRYILCIWPPHCLIGSNGYKVMPVLYEALQGWEKRFATVNWVVKGSNIFTEHYSALKADVLDPEDSVNTGLNTKLIESLQEADMILISGEASSHCVKNTITDVSNEFGEENIKKFVYLEDTSSPVPNFENFEKDFLDEMTGRGMQVTTSDKILK